MAQLFYRFGQMNASKTTQLITVAHNYQEQGKKAQIFYSAVDTRFGDGYVTSRVGIKKPAIPIYDGLDVFAAVKSVMPDCVLVDEAQFLSKKKVLELVKVVDELDIPVICYGLLRDYRGELFEGSYNLVCYADKIEEIKTVCVYCNHKATMILKFRDGSPVYSGEQIEIGGNELYKSVCRKHWFNPPKDMPT